MSHTDKRTHAADTEWAAVATFKQIKNDPMVRAMIAQADRNLEVLGYTEHGFRHVGLVARWSREILEKLGYPERDCFMAELAGYLHDTGNLVSRHLHYQSSAFLVLDILNRFGFPPEDIYMVMGAVANHDEHAGDPVSPATAALILADKSDVHQSRVRNLKEIDFDIHDRVNYAVKKSWLEVDGERRVITLNLEIDTSISNVVEYFEIFLGRMLLCRKAGRFLKCDFHVEVNSTRIGP